MGFEENVLSQFLKIVAVICAYDLMWWDNCIFISEFHFIITHYMNEMQSKKNELKNFY